MEPNAHSELRRAIEQSQAEYAFPDIEKRYPGTLLSGFLLKDAIALEEQLEAAERVVAAARDFDARFEERFIEGMAKPLNDAIAAYPARSPDA